MSCRNKNNYHLSMLTNIKQITDKKIIYSHATKYMVNI